MKPIRSVTLWLSGMCILTACSDAALAPTDGKDAANVGVDALHSPVVFETAREIRVGDVRLIFDEVNNTVSDGRGASLQLNAVTRRYVKGLVDDYERTQRALARMAADTAFQRCLVAGRQRLGDRVPQFRIQRQAERPASPTLNSALAPVTFADYTDDDGPFSTCSNIAVALYEATQAHAAAESALAAAFASAIGAGLSIGPTGWNWSGVPLAAIIAYDVAAANLSSLRIQLNIIGGYYTTNGCHDPESIGWYDGQNHPGSVSYMGLTCTDEYVYMDEYVPQVGWVTVWEGWATICE